ncbi:MAG: hypothetical protein U0871_28265 [Gemmataceae bacterium]
MNDFNLKSCLSELQSTDSDRQVTVLDRYFRLPIAVVSDADRQAVLLEAVKALEKSDNPYPIAERLLRFREEAVPAVAELLARNPSPEVTTLAALILVNNGSRLGVPDLVAEVERGGDYLVTASLALANAGFTDHIPAIIERLRQWPMPPDREFPTTEDDVVLSLLDVLCKLRVPLPDDIRRKLLDPRGPQFFRSAVERHHVGGLCS